LERRSFTTPEAWAIVQAQPQTTEYIFPYDPKSVGTAFTRACHVLGIKDLRFHDLRPKLPLPRPCTPQADLLGAAGGIH